MKNEQIRLQREEEQRIYEENITKLKSYKKIIVVENLGNYTICDSCGEMYQRTKLSIYSIKGNNSIRYCEKCSVMLFQFSYEKTIPTDWVARVTMSTEIENIYKRVILKNQIRENNNYLINNTDIPLYVNYSGQYCFGCRNTNNEFINVNLNAYDLKNKKYMLYKRKDFMCTHCGQFQIDSFSYYNHDCQKYVLFHDIFDIYGKRLASTDIDGFKKRMLHEEKSVTFSLDLKSKSLIRVSDTFCIEDSHQLQDIEGIVNVLDASGNIIEVRVPIGKCIVCNKYYIHDRDYEKLKALGMILCRIEDKKIQYIITSNNFSEWNQESILHMYGYNVSSTTNLSEAQRHTILKMLVVKKVLSRFSIIDHLEFLVNLNKNKKGFTMDVKKWEADIDFLSSMPMDVETEEMKELKVVKTINWINRR